MFVFYEISMEEKYALVTFLMYDRKVVWSHASEGSEGQKAGETGSKEK